MSEICAGEDAEGVPAESRSLAATLLDARSGKPIAESFVAISRGAAGGETEGEPIRTAVSDEAGRVFLCRVPSGEPLRLAVRGEDGREGGGRYESLAFELPPGEAVGRRDFRFRPAPALAAENAGEDRLAGGGAPEADGDGATELLGRVRRREDDRPLRGARVELVGTDRAAASGRDGLFRFPELSPGAHRLVVEHVGYRSDTVEVTLEEGASTMVRLSLETDPVELPDLTATVERTIRDRRVREFYRRMESGNGRFITGEEVERSGWLGAFRRAPNVRIRECVTAGGIRVPGCRHLSVERGRALDDGACSPDIYIDGTRFSSAAPGELAFSTQPFDALRGYSPGRIEGIEIHSAATAPPEYGGIGSGCGVVLVWTER